jgi:hypothetical protein
MRRLIATLLALAGLAFAQDQPKFVQRTVDVKYADAERIARFVNAYPGVNVRSDSSLHAIIISGPPEGVASVEALVKKFDVAPANVELTVYLISGNSHDATDDLPKDLASTAKQLHGVFAYKSYRILQSFILRDRENGRGNGTGTSGTLPNSSAAYNFHYQSITVSSGTPRIVHIDNAQFSVSTPTGNRNDKGNAIVDTSTINTDLDVGEGQKVVVGKSNVHGSDDALILVVTAQVVQ